MTRFGRPDSKSRVTTDLELVISSGSRDGSREKDEYIYIYFLSFSVRIIVLHVFKVCGMCDSRCWKCLCVVSFLPSATQSGLAACI